MFNKTVIQLKPRSQFNEIFKLAFRPVHLVVRFTLID